MTERDGNIRGTGSQNVGINKNIVRRILHYFDHIHVFLKTTGNRKERMKSDQYCKRETYQALDAGDLSH